MKAFCITVLVIIMAFIVIVLYKLAQSMLRLLYIKKYVVESESNPAAIANLFTVLCGKRNVFKNICLPSAEQQSVNLVKSDYILVNRGGILIVTVKKMQGYIENPMRGDWRQFKGDKIVQFENPFETNTNIMRAIYALLEREDYSDIPVKHFTIFTSPNVKYKNKFSQVIAPGRAAEMIEDFDKTKAIGWSKVRELSDIIGAARRVPLKDRNTARNGQPQDYVSEDVSAVKAVEMAIEKSAKKERNKKRNRNVSIVMTVFRNLKKKKEADNNRQHRHNSVNKVVNNGNAPKSHVVPTQNSINRTDTKQPYE